ncbi:hypothetical protein SESBI_02425 [Sesbania bispinosa]|nr:hypothetical protein SESBI_02425 [Sesbania bispinosa]
MGLLTFLYRGYTPRRCTLMLDGGLNGALQVLRFQAKGRKGIKRKSATNWKPQEAALSNSNEIYTFTGSRPNPVPTGSRRKNREATPSHNNQIYTFTGSRDNLVPTRSRRKYREGAGLVTHPIFEKIST